MTRTRLTPRERKAQILAAAVEMAKRGAVTREALAAAVSVSPGLVSSYFGTMPLLQRAIMREAVRLEVLPIIARGLAAGDKQAAKAPASVRAAALASLAD